MSDMSGKGGLASHLSHKRMRRSLVGGETSEFQCENLKTSSVGRKKSGDERSLICLQADLPEENMFPQSHSVLANDPKRETAVVPADKEPSVEPKEEVDVEDTSIWECEDENTNTVTNLFSSATADEENRNELTSVPDTTSSSYGRATSPLILEIKAESSLPSFPSAIASIPHPAKTTSRFPFVLEVPSEQGNDAMEDSFSCEQRELAEQSVSVKSEPVVKTEVMPAVFSLHSECTVEPMHEVWVEDMRFWENEEEMIGTDSAVICNQEMTNEDQDVDASDLYHPAVRPNLTFMASTSFSVVAEGDRKKVDGQDVKVVEPEMNDHCIGQRKERPYHCDVCKATFVWKSEFTRHMRTHIGERPFVCDVCEKSFRRKDHLSEHKVTHTAERPIQCEMCDRSFSLRQSLIRHMRTHTGERPFQCAVCERSFSQKSHLALHTLNHTDERPFKCDVCRRSFSQSCQLTVHKRTHTGERPFQCKICKKLFNQKCNLTRHLRIHPRESC